MSGWYYGPYEGPSYSGPFATKEEAIAAGRADWEEGFYVCYATNPSVKLSDWVDIENMVECAEESVFDERASYEYDDSVFDMTQIQEASLHRYVKDAIDKWQEEMGVKFVVNTFDTMSHVEYVK